VKILNGAKKKKRLGKGIFRRGGEITFPFQGKKEKSGKRQREKTENGV